MDKYFEDIGKRDEKEDEMGGDKGDWQNLFHEIKGISKTDWYKTIEMDDDEVEI